MLPVHALVVHLSSLTVRDGPHMLVHVPLHGLLLRTSRLQIPVLLLTLLGCILQASWVWLCRGAALVVEPFERSLAIPLILPVVL